MWVQTLAPYYTAIHSAAAEVRGHHEKQSFLKAIYQNFYVVYNKKLADRLGVIYLARFPMKITLG